MEKEVDTLYSREIGSFKRFFVYFIDVFIVTLIINLLTAPIIFYFNSELGTLNDALDRLLQAMESFENGLISSEQLLNMAMGVAKYGLLVLITTLPIALLVYFLYFVLQPMKTKYQTLGRKLMNVNVERVNGERLTYGKLMVRELVGTCLIYNYLGSIMELVNLIVYFTTRRTLADHVSGTNMYYIADMNYQNNGYYDNDGNYYNNAGYYDENGNYYENNSYDENGYDENGYDNNNYDDRYSDDENKY